MTTFCIASNNLHKLEEIRHKLAGTGIDVKSMQEVGILDEIPEAGKTLEENAWIKARWVFEKYGLPCFADDSGLEVEALDGAPGVFSARYAGTHGDSAANTAKLLSGLENISHREARFRTVICLIQPSGEAFFFEGTVNGEITISPKGNAGFGYDPVFRPEGFTETFAEMPAQQKNAISHRGKAIEKLVDFLKRP